MSDLPTIAYKVLTAEQMAALEADGTFAEIGRAHV